MSAGSEKLLDKDDASPSCERVYRIKGFVQDLKKNWYEVNCIWGTMSIKPAAMQEEVLVIIGQQLNQGEIRSVFRL